MNSYRLHFVLCHAFLALFSIPHLSNTGRAANVVYGTGSSASATVTSLGTSGTVFLSGSTGQFVLPTGTYAVSDWVLTDAQFNLGGRDVGFRSEPYADDKWAVMQGNGTYGMLLVAASSGTRILNLDRVIIDGGGVLSNNGGALRIQNAADNYLVVQGDVIFSNNAAQQNGGAVVAQCSTTFEGNVIFAGNKAGYRYSPGALEGTRHGGGFYSYGATSQTETRFKKSVLFSSNTATASGGGMFVSANETLTFDDTATFVDNESGWAVGTSYSGGGLYMSATSILNAKGALVFEDNRTRNYGAGLYVGTNGSATFESSLVATGNRTGVHGGGLYFLGAATFSGAVDQAFTLTNNLAGSSGGATSLGGGIYVSSAFNLQRNYLISGNHATGFGGGFWGANIRLTGSGTLANNVATANGGGGYMNGAGSVLRIFSGATIENNIAGGLGGGIYTDSRVELYAQTGDITFQGNLAGATIDSSAVSSGGTLAVTAGSGSANAIYFGGATGTLSVAVDSGQNINFYDPIAISASTAFSLLKTGAGNVLFDQYHSDISADTAVSEGSFELGSGAIYGTTGSGTFTLSSGATLSGDGEVRAATVILNDASRLEAKSGGLLQINATTLATGTNLSLVGSGTISAGVPLHAAEVRIGASESLVAESLTILGDLNLGDNAVLTYDLIASGTGDLLHATGDVNLLGTGTINIERSQTGTFELLSWAGASGLSLSDLGNMDVLYNGIATTERNSGLLSLSSGTSLVLTNATFSLSMEWTGSGNDGTWTSAAGQAGNWKDAADSGELFFRSGDSVLFGASAAGTINVANDGVTVSQLKVDGASDIVFSGGAITVDGSSAGSDTKIVAGGTSGRLIKAGAGVLQFSNTAANQFSSGIEIVGGIVAFSNADQVSIPAGGMIAFSGNGGLRADAEITGTLNAHWEIGAGANATIDTQQHGMTHSGSIISLDAASRLTKSGSGSLTLLGDSSLFGGKIDINNGRLNLGSAATRLSGTATVASGATLSGVGDSSGMDVIVGMSGLLAVGLGGVTTDTLSLRSLSLENEAMLQFTLLAGGTNSRLLVGAPGASVVSGTAYINVEAGFSSDSTVLYNLGNLASLYGSVGVKVSGALADVTTRQTADLSTSGSDLLLEFGTDKSRKMNWNLAPTQNGVWDASATDWLDTGTDASAKNKFLAGDSVSFDGVFSSTVSIQSGAAGVKVSVSELNINNTGNDALTFVGSGIFSSATTAQNAGFTASGRLVKNGTGALAFANEENYFEGGILLNEGVLAFTNGSQLAVSNTAAIVFGGNATLRADANMSAAGQELAGVLDIGNYTATFDTNGHDVVMSATTQGVGTLVKAGTGYLEYSDTASLGHGRTRVDEGILKFGSAMAASAASVSHEFEMNGGWLDLSDTGTGSPTNEWGSSLTLTGSLGRVIGGNDQILLGAGTHAFQIGGLADADRSVYVVIAGGEAKLTGSNNYMGYTRVDATGTLNISTNSQLGDTSAARSLVLNGGVARVTDSFATTRKLELRQNGTFIVDDGVITTWAGTVEDVADSFAFTKDGAGTLALSGSLGHKGGTVVQAGALSGASNLLAGEIEAMAGASVVVNQAAHGVFTGTAHGTGFWRKSGTGVMELGSAARIKTDHVAIDAGVVVNQYAGVFENVSDFTINSAGGLAGTGTVAAALLTNRGNIYAPKAAAVLSGSASLTNYGRLTIDGNYHGDGGVVSLAVLFQDNTVLSADQLVVTGSATGVTKLSLVTTEVINSSGTNTPLVLTGGSEDGAFVLDKRYTTHYGRDLAVYNDEGDWYLDYAMISPEVPSMIGVDMSSILVGRASLASLGNRMLAARMNDIPHGKELWVNGLYRRDRIEDSLYKGAKSNTYGVQVGGDFAITDDGRTLTLGAFYDYATSDIDLPDGISSTRTESNGAGVYIDYKMDDFHGNIILRGSVEDYDVEIPNTPKFTMKGNSWAAAVELGYLIEGGAEWNVEPQVQLTYQTHSIDDAVDSFERRFSLDSADSLEGRAGLLVWQEYAWHGILRIKPYMRASIVKEFKGDTVLYVSERYATEPAETFENTIGGGYGVVDAGFAMELGRGFNLYGEAAWYIGGKVEGYSINLGLGRAW